MCPDLPARRSRSTFCNLVHAMQVASMAKPSYIASFLVWSCVMLEVHSVVLVATGREAETNGKGLKQLVNL